MGLATQTFDILTRLAIGNGALVYRAVEKTTLRQVALKLLTQDDMVDHHLDIPGLLRDAPRLKSIYGSHVCQLLDAFEDDDGPVLVYEYVNGTSGLELPLTRKFEPVAALDVAAQVISALRSGERQKTPHGDLKPSNLIFFDLPEGRPYTFVLDWGLAAYRLAMPEDSLYYLAPERLDGSPATHAADLFSAGATLFYLYTGKVLVAGGSPDQVATAWRTVRPSVLAELRPDLPPKLVQWVCGLLELDPAKRPASAVEAGTVLATLHPPPPLAPPENIRPRPVSGLSQPPARAAAPAASVSSISAPPAPRSGIRTPPGTTSAPASGLRQAPASGVRPVPTSASAPSVSQHQPALNAAPKKSPVLSIVLGAVTALALGGGMIYWVKQKTQPKTTESGPSEAELIRSGDGGSSRSSRAASSGSSKPEKAGSSDKKAAASSPSGGGSKPATGPGSTGEIVVQESFAYPEGSNLSGANSGKGWSGPWEGPAATISSSTLAYPRHPTSGGSLILKESTTDTIWTRSIASVSRVLPDPKGGVWYFGVLLEHRKNGETVEGDVQFNPFSTRDINRVMRVVVSDVGSSLKFTTGNNKSMEVPKNGRPMLLLMRFEAKKAAGGPNIYDLNAKVWINPDLSQAKAGQPQIETNLRGQDLPDNFGVMIRKKAGNSVTRVDEIRYGQRWTDIAAKPGDPGQP